MAFDGIAALAGAALGFSSAFSLRLWQYRRDAWLVKLDRLCAMVELQANAATEYWLVRHTAAVENDLKQAEAKIMGMQALIDGYYEMVRERLLLPHQENIERLLGDFVDAVSGGQFGVSHRGPDFDRAAIVQSTAADLIVMVRRSTVDSLSLIGAITYATR